METGQSVSFQRNDGARGVGNERPSPVVRQVHHLQEERPAYFSFCRAMVLAILADMPGCLCEDIKEEDCVMRRGARS